MEPHERTSRTAEQQLTALLGRALNSFELADEFVDRLSTAIAHSVSLYSSRHSSAGPRRLSRETYRHSYLLADGGTATLWELVHNTARGGGTQHELYAGEADARLAASRLGFCDEGDPETDLELLDALFAAQPVVVERTYVRDNSADHARRLLRRAENPDRPGESTAQLLRHALAHRITRAFGSGFTHVTLYEHAFLLSDGSESSLWEIEHTATPDGRHMCEVYTTERTAREAMKLRARYAEYRP
ncbi:DUF6227 family protein [Streptomyces sannanensis]|uniref:DUF6227 family protein n=1 Tax=Streptomyces sannanensis TaxID=285536 RepID=A0ABP6SC42_9ACTN